jgi:hypothetical protein
MLYHVSEEANIAQFVPRYSESLGEAVVWAVDSERLRNYLLPRECPRVTYYAGTETSAEDAERFLGSSLAVVAVESGWMDRIRACRLYCYQLPEDSFDCLDACAGYYVSRSAVIPSRMDVIDDVLGELARRRVEARFMPDLWALRDAVVSSTLQFSVIRMRNANPRSNGG